MSNQKPKPLMESLEESINKMPKGVQTVISSALTEISKQSQEFKENFATLVSNPKLLESVLDNQDIKEQETTRLKEDRLESRRFVYSDDIAEPEYLFQVGDIPCMPLQGIIAISGEAKKGKSQFLTILEAVLMSGKPFGQIKRRYDSDKPLTILHIDTEQNPYDVARNQRRMFNLAGWTDNNAENHGIYTYRFRTDSVEERLELLDMAIEKHNPNVLVIDGIMDLTHGVLDDKDAGFIQQLMLYYAGQGMAVFVVIHVNPGSDRMTGFTGTALMKKCSDKWFITKENRVFQVKHISRDREADYIPTFRFNELGNLEPCDPIRKMTKEEQKTEECKSVIIDVFSEQPSYSTKEELVRAIMDNACTTKNKAVTILQLARKYNWTSIASDKSFTCNLPF